jgi:DNA modification methylase
VIVREFKHGIALCADSTQQSTVREVERYAGKVPLIVVDPPYGNILLDQAWDVVVESDKAYAALMRDWTAKWSDVVVDGGAFYVWGGIGRPGFRPFFRYVLEVEEKTPLRMATMVTWSKKRAYGVRTNYLFTREECAYFVKGNPKKPRTFHVPYLDKKRNYAGFNKDYPARSEFYRRTNVWTDITEILRGKWHPAQKARKLYEIPIEVHTEPGEWVVDPFAGSGNMALIALWLGRKFAIVERDEEFFADACKRIEAAEAAL